MQNCTAPFRTGVTALTRALAAQERRAERVGRGGGRLCAENERGTGSRGGLQSAASGVSTLKQSQGYPVRVLIDSQSDLFRIKNPENAPRKQRSSRGRECGSEFFSSVVCVCRPHLKDAPKKNVHAVANGRPMPRRLPVTVPTWHSRLREATCCGREWTEREREMIARINTMYVCSGRFWEGGEGGASAHDAVIDDVRSEAEDDEEDARRTSHRACHVVCKTMNGRQRTGIDALTAP